MSCLHDAYERLSMSKKLFLHSTERILPDVPVNFREPGQGGSQQMQNA